MNPESPKVRRIDPEAWKSMEKKAGMEMLSLSQDKKQMLSKIIQGADILEVYSPVRVNASASKFGLSPGMSLDLSNGYVL